MSDMSRRFIPYALIVLTSLTMLINYFFEIPVLSNAETYLLSVSVILLSASLGLGAINLVRHHVDTVRTSKNSKDSIFSALLLISFVVMLAVGVIYGGESSQFDYIYSLTLLPLESTLSVMGVLYQVLALYHAIRIKNIQTAFFYLTLMVIFLGMTPLQMIHPAFEPLSSWFNTVVNMAAQRGLKISLGFGLVVLSVRILLGKERSFLGRLGISNE